MGFYYINDPKKLQHTLAYASFFSKFEQESTKSHNVFINVLTSTKIRHIPDYLTTEDGLVFDVDSSLPKALNIH